VICNSGFAVFLVRPAEKIAGSGSGVAALRRRSGDEAGGIAVLPGRTVVSRRRAGGQGEFSGPRRQTRPPSERIRCAAAG